MNKIIRVTGMDIRAAEGTAMRRMAWALVLVLASGAAFGAKRPQTAKAPAGSPTEKADLTAWDAIATGALEQVPAFVPAPPEPDAPPAETAGLAPQAWRERLAELAGLRHGDVVPGVDLFLSGDDERLVAVLLVKPGSDVTSVRLALPEGAEVESGAQGHVIVRLAGGDLALLRPGIVQRQDGQLVTVHGGWAASAAGLDLTLGKFDGGAPLYARFELLSLGTPKQLERFDRNHNGRVEMPELRPVVTVAPPAPDALAVTATQADSFSVDTDTDTLADPGDVIRYTVVISAAGGTATALTFNDTPDLDTTLVGGSINVSPLARDDSYGAAGNVTLNVASAAAGLFANDNDFLGDTFTLTTPAPNVATPTTGGGSITIQADGTFAYTTPAGQSSGTDTFTYTLTDTGGLTGTGTVTFNISGTVWFVDRDAPGGGTGTQANPFNALSPTTVAGVGGSGDVDGPNDIIYLYDRAAATDYTGGLELEAGQRLVGSGVALIVGGNTILPATTPPVLVNTSGNALTLIAGATVDARPHVEGITINAGNNAAIAGSGALGTLTLDTVTINTSGTGSGLSLTNQTGSLTVTNGAFGGTGSGGAVVLSGGAGSVTLTGAPISKTGGRLVDVQSKTGGTVTFGSVSGAGAATDAIVAQNNTSTTLAFPSGFSATTTAGRGLFAINGGTINVTGTSSTISATGGAALDVTGTSFGAGLTLASASSTNSTAEGVKLSNVTGPLTINGGAISGSAATFAAFSLAQGSANVTYAGTIDKTNGGRVVDVQTRAGGTVQFSGAVTANGASTGINVSGATAATTVNFSASVDLGTSATRLTGGTALTVNHNANASTTTFSDLEVFTTGQAGIDASNGGTFNVTTGQVNAGGRALNLSGLALGATFTNVISAGSAAEGVRLNAATGTLTATTTTVTNPTTQGISVGGSSANVTFASGAGTTSVSGSGTQRVFVGTSTGTLAFGNTTVSGGTDGVSLQNNSGGSRTFGALTITSPGGVGFLHALGGGAVTVGGVASIATPTGVGVQIDGNGATTIAFGSTLAVTKTNAGTGVALGTTATNGGTVNLGVLSVSTSNGPAIVAGSATTTTPLTTSGASTLSATNGAAIDARGTAFAATFTGNVSSTNSTTQGLNLNTCTGTLTMSGGGSISGAAGSAVAVNAGSPTVTYSGTVTQNNAQRVVDIQNTTANTITLSGTITGGASSTGVNINAANGSVTLSTLNLGTSGSRMTNQAVTINGGTGTYSLGTVGIFTTGGTAKGISAVNADGTLNTIGGTVDAAGAAAIDIDGPVGLTTLGMTLTAAHANGGTNGVLVRDTNGTFSVAGTGAAGTGGTIQNMTQRGARFSNATGISLAWMNFSGNGSNQDSAGICGDALNGTNTNCGAGIDLQGVNSATFDRLALSGGTQMGINGNDVTNLTITNTTVQNAGNEVLEDGVQLVNLKGTCAITDSSFTGNFHRQLEVQNSSGTLTNLTLTRVTLDRGTYVSTAAQGLLVAGQNTANMTVTVKDSNLLRNFGSGLFGQSINTANVTFVIGDVAVPANGNTFTDNSLGVQVVADSGSTQTSTVANNSATVSAVVTSGSTPFSFRKSLSATGLVTGLVTANQIGNATALSGNNCAGCNGMTIQDEGSSGAMRMTVTSNLIQHVNQRGIEALLQLDDAMGVVLTGNTIQSPDGTVGQAVFGQSGNDATDVGTLCMDITGNTAGGLWDTGAVGAGGRNMRLRQAPAGGTTAFRLRNIGGTTATDANNFLNGNNTNALAGCSATTGYTTGSAVCF